MAEEEKKSSKLGGYIKAGLASVFSLVSGAVLMYLSPVVNSAIKPSKPVANFAFQTDGLAVTFTNRASGGSEGWWDFGDGSALEPFVASQQALQHTYARAGIYNVKLNLRNFIGDENERTVPVPLDTLTPNLPSIENFEAIRLTSEKTAPAIFHLVGRVKNADLALWVLGDEKAIDIEPDPTGNLDRLVTLEKMGYYTLRLVAVKDKQVTEKSKEVWVDWPDDQAPGATLQVAYDAVRISKRTKSPNISVAFPAQEKGSSFKFTETRSADPGFQIVKAELVPLSKAQVNAKLELSADKTRVILTGELPRSAGPKWEAQIKLTEEMRTPEKKNMEPVPVVLKVPGTTVIPIPHLAANWEAKQKSLNLQLRDGTKVIWYGNKLPVNQPVQFKNHACRVTANETGDQIRLVVNFAESNAVNFPSGH